MLHQLRKDKLAFVFLFILLLSTYVYAISSDPLLFEYTPLQPRAPADDTTSRTPTPTTATATTGTTDSKNHTTPSSTLSSNATSSINGTSTPLVPLKPIVHIPYNQTIVNKTAVPNIAYQLHCKVDDPFCTKVENGIVQAISEFAKVVDIKTKIIIKIKYYKFCSKSCSNSTFGWGMPSSQFILPFDDGPDLNHVYPQALAKQLVPSYNTSSVWSASDVTIELNHDAYMESVKIDKALSMGWNGTGTPPTGRFWFLNDTTYGNNTSIDNDQVDFRYVVLHELLHGLGFLSSWAAYFWSTQSPFRLLVEHVLDFEQLKIITPGMVWSVKTDGAPVYVTGFQPTMIFDKYLISYNAASNPQITELSALGFEMQNFCADNKTQAYIQNFVTSFNVAPQAKAASDLWNTMAKPQSLVFNFTSPAVKNSTFSTNPYLRTAYPNMTLLTGADVLDTPLEQFNQTNGRPGAAISHVDDQYNSSVDFLMTQDFISGLSLEDIVQEMYQKLPVSIQYNTTLANGSVATNTYISPIGPGILRILDSMGYSTALTNTSYIYTGQPVEKFRSVCDDINDNSPGKAKVTAASTTSAAHGIYTDLQGVWPTFVSSAVLLIWRIAF